MIVRRTDGRILWTHFRDYTGVFVGPIVDPDPDAGVELGLPELVFEADQYAAEVHRAGEVMRKGARARMNPC
jgi:hypothetical protein